MCSKIACVCERLKKTDQNSFQQIYCTANLSNAQPTTIICCYQQSVILLKLFNSLIKLIYVAQTSIVFIPVSLFCPRTPPILF
ncbi:AAEL001763-PA [Aedes aegypti]|uniref:AAEL001763-PA n=1 Tax=Aedes aegypti TaxID=7159 RepID=Q17K94_AEDAE|nr:AAEL001763-PA [Aedes aegypti]